MDFVKKFLLGNYSLTKTFWIIYFIPTTAFSIIHRLLQEFESYSSPWIILIFLMVYKILCVIAVWNSSAKYTGKKRWFYLTRVYLAFEVIFFSVRLIMIIPLALVVLFK
jgi:hypothetical protein